jgi:hypothetical protein
MSETVKAPPGGAPLRRGRRAQAKARLEARQAGSEASGGESPPKPVAPVRRGPWRYKGEILQAREDSVYTPVVGDTICQLLVQGLSLRAICEDEGMPSLSTVLRWVSAGELPDADPAHAAFTLQYHRARLEQAEAYADATVAIADAAAASEANPQLVRLQIDARKWYAGKIKPSRFGEASLVRLTGADGGAVQVQVEERQSLLAQVLQALAGEALAARPEQALLDVTPRVVDEDQK